MHKLFTTYTHGSVVYISTDTAQLKRIVIAFEVLPGNLIRYEVACGESSSFHFEIELCSEIDNALKMGLDKTDSNNQ